MSQELFAPQSGSYSAEVTRRAMFSWAARTAANSPGIISGGLLSATDLQCTAPASGMTVNVGTGEALVGGTEGGAQGGYYFRNTATYSATVTAANATNPRVDAIVVTAADSFYTEPSDVSGGTNGGVIATVKGTPTPGATLSNLSGAPAIPSSSLLLAWVLVPANATSIVTTDIENVAAVSTLQLYPAPTWTPAPGSWVTLGLGLDLVNASGYYAARIRQEGSIARLSGFLQNGSGSTISAGATVLTSVPTALAPSASVSLAAVVDNTPTLSLAALNLPADSTSITLQGASISPSGYLSLEGLTYPLV